MDSFLWNLILENFATICWHSQVLVNNITGFWREEMELFARLKNIQSKHSRKNWNTHFVGKPHAFRYN